MKSALRLFRDLNPFGLPQAARKAAEVRELLNTVVGLSSHEMVTELTAQVIPAITRQDNLHMRFKFLEEARAEAEKALPILERKIDHSPLPLSMATATSALAADNLLKALANAYFNIAKAIVGGNQHKAFGRMFQRVALRAMSLLARRQQFAYRTYSRPSASTWNMLHELYQMATTLRDRLPEEDIAPIEHLYLSTLLLAYIEPSKLARTELPAAIFCTQQLAVHAAIHPYGDITVEAGGESACFLLHPEEGNAGVPLVRLAPEHPIFDGFIVDCSGVLTAIDQMTAHQLENPEEPALDIPPAVLQTLRLALGGRSMRRFARKRFKPHADLVGGLGEVVPFIESTARNRRAADAVNRDGPKVFMASEWSLIDQSPDGFLVRFIQGEKWKVGVGNIVALQPRESSKVHVCMVRRIATNKNGRLELGLQALSPAVSVIDLPGYEANRRGLLLHRLPAYDNLPGIVAHPGQVSSGHKLKFTVKGETRLWQVGRRLEVSEGLEFFALVPL